ncbi:plastocyanin/azurin family copper-binding protein [Kiloniella sp.]|uniref:plastocyanin/azurin family copper-binding protein n=1 Tax=Kiloniella sp. TaxID=1938587 RepID=UPI003B014193
MRLTRRYVLGRAAAACAVAAIGPALISKAARAGSQAQAPVEHHVEISGFNFAPDKLVVRYGDTITWTNRDIAPHTATADDKSWDTGTISKGDKKSLMVTEGMSLTYYCRFHPMMKAGLAVAVSNG